MLSVVFSVSEFNEVVNNHLGLLGEVVVEGEISELKISQNKWIYITIKDEFASVNVWGTVFQIRNINALEIGMMVKVMGRASIYQKTGRFSLNAYEIKPSGEGSLRMAYEKLKKQLEKEGLFDESRKRAIPRFPERIGLITAKNSQAYNDFIKVTRERMGGLHILFYPVQVQGDGAVQSILKALEYFNDKGGVDVIVITRGGGSLEDLSAFNDEVLTRAVFGSRIPVISAIGHEGDVSLVELASDLRASTPSNAGELVVRERSEVLRDVDGYLKDIQTSIQRYIVNMKMKTDKSMYVIKSKIIRVISDIRSTMSQFYEIKNRIIKRIDVYRDRLEFEVERLRLLSPESSLSRGFSLITDKNGKLIKSVSDVELDDEINTIMRDGMLVSLVKLKKTRKIT